MFKVIDCFKNFLKTCFRRKSKHGFQLPTIESTHPIHFRGPSKTAASWSDLLAFSNILEAANWDLYREESLPYIDFMLQRLARFSHIMHLHHSPFEEALLVNDGILRTFNENYCPESQDDEPSGSLVSWLEDVLQTHSLVIRWEKQNGLPGIRTVICEGDMMMYHDHPFPSYDPYERPDLNEVPQNLAFLRPISTQLNTAFSKCYIADSHGSKAGLKHGGVYIEEALVTNLIENHGCILMEDRYLFLTNEPAILAPNKYSSTRNLYFVSSSNWADVGFLRDHRSWCEFSRDKITFSSRGIDFCFRELIAFSPPDKFSLFWVYPFDGSEHGYDVDPGVILDPQLRERAVWVEPGAPDHPILEELRAAGAEN